MVKAARALAAQMFRQPALPGTGPFAGKFRFDKRPAAAYPFPADRSSLVQQ